MTPASIGGEQQISISGGCQSPTKTRERVLKLVGGVI